MPSFDPTEITPTKKQSRKDRRAKRRQGRKHRAIKWSAGIVGVFLLVVGLGIGVGFGTPFGTHWRLLAAETIASTRHYQWARYITTAKEYEKVMKALDGIAVRQADVGKINVAPSNQVGQPAQAQSPIQVIPLQEHGYTGDVILVHNPMLVRLVPAKVQGDKGEYITDMAKRVGAIAGVNASGFEDPNGNGWGGIPVGLEYVGGQTIQASKSDPSWATVGFTKNGVMVMGNYSASELQSLGVRDAMQFHPELVVNGQPTITQGDGGWGSDPRTAIGQEKDGTVIFVTINGRLHGGSIGATQRQVMDIMLRYHAVNACAMDGGSSSVMYDEGKIINSPSTIDPNGQRHLPDAWMVFPTEKAASSMGN